MLTTFGLTLMAWIFFRSESVTAAVAYLGRIVKVPYLGLDYQTYGVPLVYALIPLLVEWPLRTRQHGLDIGHLPMFLRWILYLMVILAIVVCGKFGSQQFIYFQF